MTIKQIIFAAIAGAILGAAASTTHAANRETLLDGVFICDAQVWPADTVPFNGKPESDEVRRYTITVNAGGFVVGNFDMMLSRDMKSAGWTEKGRYGDKNEWAFTAITDKHQPFFGYRNATTGDSVGFFNCVAKRKF